MRLTETRLKRLVALGLTESQARAYLALLDLGPTGIGAVAKASDMPRTWLYTVVRELHVLGLVDIAADDQGRYAPRSLEGFVRQRLHALDAERDALAAALPELLAEFAPAAGPAPTEGATRVFRGRANAVRHLTQGIEGARSSLVLVCTPFTMRRLAAAGLDGVLARRAEAGVAVQVVAPDGQAAAPAASVLLRRPGRDAAMEVLLVDGASCVAWVPRPDDGRLGGAADEGVVSSSPAFYALLSEAVAALASGPPPPPQRA